MVTSVSEARPRAAAARAAEVGHVNSEFSDEAMAVVGWRSALVILVVTLACTSLCRFLSDDLPPVRNVEGVTAQGFKRAAEAFRLLLLSGEERGAALAASYNGQLVVDVWGGYADFDAWRPWRKDTVSRTFLTTHAVTVASLLLLADRQQIDLARPVASYWPEFAANGKRAVTVAQLLRREVLVAPPETAVRLSQLSLGGGSQKQAGSPASAPVDRNQDGRSSSGAAAFDLSALLSDRPLVNASAVATGGAWQQQQQQSSELLELYVDQLVRRVDRRGRGLAEFARDDIIQPYGLSCYVGLPAEVLPNTARLLLRRHSSSSLAGLVDLLLAPGDLLWRLLSSFGGSDKRLSVYDIVSPSQLNDFDVQKKPILSVNGFATARSLVRLYELLTGVSGGASPLLSTSAAAALLDSPAASDPDTSAESSSAWYEQLLDSGHTLTVSGLLRQQGIVAANNTAYVGVGSRGQHVLVDPENNLVMAYLTNQLSGRSAGLDPRFLAVLKAVYGCLPKS